MTKAELEKEAEKYLDEKCKDCYMCSYDEHKDPYRVCQRRKDRKQAYLAGAEPREKRIEELEAQIEKLIDFVLSKTECCDVCPITDTCINSEGTCPYAGILSKGEEAVTREWLMQKIEKEIKENE